MRTTRPPLCEVAKGRGEVEWECMREERRHLLFIFASEERRVRCLEVLQGRLCQKTRMVVGGLNVALINSSDMLPDK